MQTMKKKLYVTSEMDYSCYLLSWHLEGARNEGDTTITLLECEPVKLPGIGWCREHENIIEKSDRLCGRECDKYAPRNSRSGICKHYTPTTYEPNGVKVVFDVATGKPLINKL
jgi:hypothetical protein